MFVNKSRHKICVTDVIRHQNKQVCKRNQLTAPREITAIGHLAEFKIGSSFSMPMLLQRRQRTLIE